MTQDPRLPWLTIGSDGLSPAARSRSSRSPSSSTSLAAPSSGFGSQHFLQRHQRSRASVYSSRPSSGYGSFHSVDVESTRRPKSAPVRSGDGISTLRRLTRPRTGFLRFSGPRPTIQDNSRKVEGPVEYLCFVKPAVLHERDKLKKPKYRFAPPPPPPPPPPRATKTESKPTSHVSFAWMEENVANNDDLGGAETISSDSEDDDRRTPANFSESLQPVLEEDDDLSPDWHPVRFEPEEKDEEENEEEIISVEDLDDVREDETPAVIEEEEKEEKEDESKSVEVLPTIDIKEEVREEPKVKRKFERKPKKEKQQQQQRKTEAAIHKRKWKGVPKLEDQEYEPPELKPLEPWLKHRFALSKKSCRFELPMDMKLLEDLSPLEYLKRFSVISDRRRSWYSKVFRMIDRARKRSNGILNMTEVENALMEVHFHSSTKEQIKDVFQVASIAADMEFNREQFYGLAALSERLLVTSFLSYKAAEDKGAERDVLETTDFEAIDWKLKGVSVHPDLRRLFDQIRS